MKNAIRKRLVVTSDTVRKMTGHDLTQVVGGLTGTLCLSVPCTDSCRVKICQ
jgi:hypothetical protein